MIIGAAGPETMKLWKAGICQDDGARKNGLTIVRQRKESGGKSGSCKGRNAACICGTGIREDKELEKWRWRKTGLSS